MDGTSAHPAGPHLGPSPFLSRYLSVSLPQTRQRSRLLQGYVINGDSPVWRTLRRLILETASQHVDAINQLEQFAEADQEITRYQTAGQQLVEIFARDAADSKSRDLARRVLT